MSSSRRHSEPGKLVDNLQVCPRSKCRREAWATEHERCDVAQASCPWASGSVLGSTSGAPAAGHGLGLESVGVAASRLGALVGSSAEDGGALELHGFVEEGFQRLGHAVKSVLGRQGGQHRRARQIDRGGPLRDSFRLPEQVKRKPPWPTPFEPAAACGAKLHTRTR